MDISLGRSIRNGNCVFINGVVNLSDVISSIEKLNTGGRKKFIQEVNFSNCGRDYINTIVQTLANSKPYPVEIKDFSIDLNTFSSSALTGLDACLASFNFLNDFDCLYLGRSFLDGADPLFYSFLQNRKNLEKNDYLYWATQTKKFGVKISDIKEFNTEFLERKQIIYR